MQGAFADGRQGWALTLGLYILKRYICGQEILTSFKTKSQILYLLTHSVDFQEIRPALFQGQMYAFTAS